MSENKEVIKPNLNRQLNQFPEKLLVFLELFGNYLSEDFFDSDVDEQMDHALIAIDLTLKPNKSFILVDADMCFRDLFTN